MRPKLLGIKKKDGLKILLLTMDISGLQVEVMESSDGTDTVGIKCQEQQ